MFDLATDLQGLLASSEWYDNHAIVYMSDCMRKLYLNQLAPHPSGAKGLRSSIGPGGNFGSCIHAACEAYYLPSAWLNASEVSRRASAFRAFSREWHKLFPTDPPDRKHDHNNGLIILDHYFDQMLPEDRQWRPVDVEVTCIVRIEWSESLGLPWFRPFLFVARLDGIFERVRTGEWYVFETKTTGSGASRELMRLKLDRQPTGYVTIVRMIEDTMPHPHSIAGVLANVVLIASEKREAVRDIFNKTRPTCFSWLRQTILLVERWRTALELWKRLQGSETLASALDAFPQETGSCTKYGLCPYYDICLSGPGASLEKFVPNTWTPLRGDET